MNPISEITWKKPYYRLSEDIFKHSWIGDMGRMRQRKSKLIWFLTSQNSPKTTTLLRFDSSASTEQFFHNSKQMNGSFQSRTPRKHVKTIQEVLTLVDWVNSLDIPSCALVNQIEDLKSGVVIGDIIAWLLDKETLQGLERHVMTAEDCIENWKIILFQLAPFLDESFLSIKPQEIIDDETFLVDILRFLAQLQDPQIATQNMDIPRTVETQEFEQQEIMSDELQEFPIEQAKMAASHSKPPKTPVQIIKTAQFQPQQFVMETPKQMEIQKYPQEIPRQPPKPYSEQGDYEHPLQPPQQAVQQAKPIPQELKYSIVRWLESLRILRKNSLDPSILPDICRSGVLFCDLVNRLEGRSAPIKGLERNPKNKTQALANVNKMLTYMRKFPKMNSRYLWSSNDILQANENVIWGLLQDFKQYYSISKKPKKTNSINKPVTPVLPQTEPPTPPVPQPKIEYQPQQPIIPTKVPEKVFKNKSNSLRSYAQAARSRTPSLKSTSIMTGSTYQKKREYFHVDTDMKAEVQKWLLALDIQLFQDDDTFTDPLRNGVLLCELIKILQGVRVKITPNPRNMKSLKDNFDRALSALRQKKAGVPNSLLVEPDSYLQEPEKIWALLYSLHHAYPQAVPVAYQPSSLPYGAIEIKILEQSLLNWLVNIEIINTQAQVQFLELIPEMKRGLLLCELVSRIFQKKIPSVVFNPTTEQSALNNIRKALELLRKHPRMSQKFTWSEKQILKGNLSVTLGLLEDVYRLYDGLQARRAGADYHKDGPYLGRISVPVEDFNATFGSSDSFIPHTSSNPKLM